MAGPLERSARLGRPIIRFPYLRSSIVAYSRAVSGRGTVEASRADEREFSSFRADDSIHAEYSQYLCLCQAKARCTVHQRHRKQGARWRYTL
jgi:hypothetical protein